ncbi:ATP-binding protein [Chryseobacterium sp. CKR4-1]|uniref:ATP-binding protein n=1 Tax=Chryseobacterium sp. CKR4-1 TaxID=3068896 RepID=UPI0027967661|nr:ATP-binding protein [Chryseobacterium sp. CKR4-1]MDQ1806247.1 ATP-binding protein [Chryseobacterium sp. CKR4-1]
MKKQNHQYDIVRPQPESLLQSARSFGYSVETALADLIDNSITAGAKDIKITFGIDRYSSYIKIEDNGKGMNEKELLNAMKMGSFNPLDNRNNNDLGRFGLGLKTASFSQCKRLTVKTRNKSNNEFIRCWDLDIVKEKKDWILLRNCADKNSEKLLGKFPDIGSGTIVLWEKLDRLVESEELKSDKEHFYRKFVNVRKHLGLVFHRFIEEKKIRIFIFDEELHAINPFNISNEYPSVELAEEQLSIKQQNIYIQPFILPHESKLSNVERNNLEITKGWIEHQGIYLYRNKRLIADGTWLDLGFKKKENQRLCRIRIDIPNTLDPEWQIDVKKASAKIPDVIRKRIKTICIISIEKAVKVYTHRGAYLRRTELKKEIVYLWKARQKKGKRFYEINKEHPIYNLIADNLEEEAYIFNDYMKLVGESLPISFIVSDFSDHSIVMKDFFEDSKKELKLIYENTLSALINAGFSEKEATEKVNSIECFQQLK